MFDKYTPFREPQRQRLVFGESGVLERGQVFLPAASWDALKRLGIASHRSGSQVIEALIAIADKAQRGKRP